MRPPNLSVNIPSGTRTSEPVSTGVAVSKPNSVALSPSVFLIGMPITPNIIHTMKHTVNASVLTISTDSACRLRACVGVAGTEGVGSAPSLLTWRWPSNSLLVSGSVAAHRA